MPVPAQLRDASIRHAIYQQRFAGSVVKEIMTLLNRADRDLMDKIRARLERLVDRGFDTGSITTERLKALLYDVRGLTAAMYVDLSKNLTRKLYEFASYEVTFHTALISGAVPAGVSVTAPASALVRAAVTAKPFQGRLLSEWVSGLSNNKFARLRDAIRIGLVEGETTEGIVRRIVGTRGANFQDGLLNIDRRNADALVRTAINHTATEARENVYQENKRLLDGVQWVSTLDSDTTPVCQARDGQIYPVSSGPRPPAHIRCRSTTVPSLKEEYDILPRETLSRASHGASGKQQVPATQTYQTWLRNQPAEFQDEVLGKTKGALFRRGGMTVDKFVNRNGDELTLVQLRKKYPAEFKMAGLSYGD